MRKNSDIKEVKKNRVAIVRERVKTSSYIGVWWFALVLVHAAEPPLLNISVDISDKAALQRGAKLFMNYCSGCHSLRYLRYNRMAHDLGLTTFDGSIDADLLKSNLIFTQATIHDPIQISMPEVDARQWFGRLPPDLSLTARERGVSWVYTFLNSFYADSTRSFGANNRLVPNVGMPNVIVPLREDSQMTQQQLEASIKDLVTFLSYVAEPFKIERQRMGWVVLPFLCLCLGVVGLLKTKWRS